MLASTMQKLTQLVYPLLTQSASPFAMVPSENPHAHSDILALNCLIHAKLEFADCKYGQALSSLDMSLITLTPWAMGIGSHIPVAPWG